MNILIGDNGVGKTSILESIIVALGGFLANGVSAKNILLSDVRMKTVNVGSASTSIQYFTPTKIDCELQTEESCLYMERIREGAKEIQRLSRKMEI